jgi:hypothetical protein
MVKSSKQLQAIRALGVPITDIIHERIHAGEMFSATTYDASVADDGSLDILFSVSSNMSAHLAYIVRAGGDAEILFYEGPTISNNGTALTPSNRNRILKTASLHSIFSGPTISDAGDQLENQFVPGGTAGFLAFTPGSEGSLFKEYVLAPGEDYLLRCFNRSGDATTISLQLDWYEPISGVA